jgi:hypothetical protein
MENLTTEDIEAIRYLRSRGLLTMGQRLLNPDDIVAETDNNANKGLFSTGTIPKHSIGVKQRYISTTCARHCLYLDFTQNLFESI